MAVISVNTPSGVKRVMIAGDTPTDAELDRLRSRFPDDPDFSYDVVAEQQPEEETATIVDEPDSEIESSSLRYQYGRMDTDEERAGLLTRLLGEGTFERVAEDVFVVDQSKVDPDKREKYGLSDTGQVYVDKPGLSWYDVVDFAGESGAPIAAAVGMSLIASGFGFVPGILMVGAAAAAGKAADEGVEYIQGLQRQTPGEVAAAVAMEGGLALAGEGAGRVVAKMIGRLWKGPGPQISAQRIEELMKKGIPEKLARKYATEEGLAKYRGVLAGGGRPTIFAATGKSLAARLLAVNEKIIPNPKVANDNVRFIRQTIDDLRADRITEVEARAQLDDQAKAIAAQVNIQLSDPDKVFRAIRSHLEEVVEEEMQAFAKAYVPATGVPTEYAEAAKLSARLFQSEANAAYQAAEKLIGPKSQQFSTSNIQETLRNLRKNQKFIKLEGGLFDIIDNTPQMSLADLQQFKAALRVASGDPELVGTGSQFALSDLIKATDDTLNAKFAQLSQDVALGWRSVQYVTGKSDTIAENAARLARWQEAIKTNPLTPKPRNIAGTFHTLRVTPGEKENLRQGLAAWKESNTFYGDGQEHFNNAAVNMINKNANDKYFVTNLDILDTVIREGNAPQLRMYLKAVTPTTGGIAKIAQDRTRAILEQVKTLVGRGEYTRANALVTESGLDDIVPKINPWMEKLPTGDVYRVSETRQYIQSLDDLVTMARAGSRPDVLRNAVRDSLAKSWIDRAKGGSLTDMGEFAPGKFAQKFNSLGPETQNLLFGKENATTMRNVMKNFSLVGAKQDKLLAELPKIGPWSPEQGLRVRLQGLKKAVDTNIEESKFAVLSSIRQGSITNANELVAGVLKQPSSYKKLASIVGETELNKVGGLHDMVMKNLIYNSFKTPLDESSIQSGKWGKSLLEAIDLQNKNGALSTILGNDVIQGLKTLGKGAVDISDVETKGFGGIAAAPAAMALIWGAWVAPFSTLTAAGLIVASSRILRNRGFLKLLTSSRLRADDYKKAIEAGADLPSLAWQRESGKTSYALNRLGSIVSSEIGLVSSSGLYEMPIRETEKQAQVSETLLKRASGEGFTAAERPQLPPQFTMEQALQSNLEESRRRGLDPRLLEVEQRKLLGLSQ